MNRLLYGVLVLFVFLTSCNTQKKSSKFRFTAPEAGTIVNIGQAVPLQVSIPADFSSFDSVVYTIDGQFVARQTDSTPVTLDTDQVSFGSRTLSAKLYRGEEQEVTYSNIVVVPTPPKRYGFKVINSYPHDPQAYTQGLEFDGQGMLYESTGYESSGKNGKSSLRRVNYQTGEVLQRLDLDEQYFGEGLTLVDDKIIQLTWRSKVGFVYNKKTFARIGQFAYGQSQDGWGLCYDGHRLIKSDGTSKLYFLNKDTYAEEGFIEVYNDKGPVDNLNELEYIDGKVYANIYTKDTIVIINPETGAIEGEINLIGIHPDKAEHNNELNGIAYDHRDNRLFITGKLWNKLYQIELVAR